MSWLTLFFNACIGWRSRIREFPLNILTFIKKMINFEATKCFSNLPQFNLLLGANHVSRQTPWEAIVASCFLQENYLSFIIMLLGASWGRWWRLGRRRWLQGPRCFLPPLCRKEKNYFTVKKSKVRMFFFCSNTHELSHTPHNTA